MTHLRRNPGASVVSGGALLSPAITLRMIRDFARRPSQHRRDSVLGPLTAREAEAGL
jgi:hypothetical protein